jgi:RNA polymerase sigma-70 factor (ECF subfamily)
MDTSIYAMSSHAASTDHRDEAGFEALAAVEASRLFRLAIAIVDDRAEAEDAVQETMLIARRRWSSLRTFTNPTAWLTRVCVRQCVARRRSRYRRQMLNVGDGSLTEGLPLPHLQGELIDLHRAYAKLSPRQRALTGTGRRLRTSNTGAPINRGGSLRSRSAH